jgi:hypothetical protein
LRDDEVQQPKTAATLSFSINSRAFSANSGQSEAGSTTTASSFLPSNAALLVLLFDEHQHRVFQRRF